MLVLILSPAAIASQWVPDEMNAAIVRAKQGYMRPPLVVQCADLPLRDIPDLWTTYQRVDMMCDYGFALSRVLVALGIASPAPSYTPPALLPPISVVSPAKSDGPLKVTPLPNSASLKPPSVVWPLRAGLLVGIVLGAVLFLVRQTASGQYLSRHIGDIFAGDVIRFLIILSAAFIVGFRTYGRAQRIRDSLLVGTLIGFVGMLLATNVDVLGESVQFHIGLNDLYAGLALVMLRDIGLAIVFGLVAGALGGLVGRWRAKA